MYFSAGELAIPPFAVSPRNTRGGEMQRGAETNSMSKAEGAIKKYLRIDQAPPLQHIRNIEA